MSNESIDFPEWLRRVEQKWQHEWESVKLFETNPTPGKHKFFITVAYPYVNSTQHIGHARTYGLTDTYARFKRMQGNNVLYPQGFHYTGTPILAMAQLITEGDERILSDLKNIHLVPEELFSEFQEPLKLARYFHNEIREGMKKMGFSIDWRREFTTIDPVYIKFIEWQFRTLHKTGWLIQGSHPVGWCPKCGNAVGMHDTLHDKEPEMAEVTVLKIPFDGKILPAATYRPETIFGLTNMFVNPKVTYKLVIIEGEEWILSQEAILKFNHQAWEITETEKEISGSDLVGKSAKHPLSGKILPLLPASFVDPGYGTGIVMSVPAHAPFDLIALADLEKTASDPKIRELARSIVPIPLIRVEGYGEIPAQDALEHHQVTDQNDPAVEKATEDVYSREFHIGRMMENTGSYAGLSVAEAKDRVHADLIEQNKAKLMYELTNRPVYCRCGTEILVHIMQDQWFLNYGDPNWKERAYKCLNRMSLVPVKIRTQFDRVFDWLSRRACARKAGLGTPFPFDTNWIIESLSDSTIYMAYYCLSHIITQYNLTGEDFSDAIFDYIFFGNGGDKIGNALQGTQLTQNILDEMRDNFSYYYPLDSRNSGPDLIPNHLSFMVFNHVAIFPEAHWPRQIFVNGYVTMEGEGMSKSLGNVVPIGAAIDQYSADLIRTTVLYGASLLTDAEFNPRIVRWISRQLEKLRDVATLYADVTSDLNGYSLELIDQWMLARLQERIDSVTGFLEIGETRDALQQVLYSLNQDIDLYLQIKGQLDAASSNEVTTRVMRNVIETGIKLLAPVAPHFGEEMWEVLGNEKFISTTTWPTIDQRYVNESVKITVEIVLKTIQDVKDILNVLKEKPQKGTIILAPEWKYELFDFIRELVDKGTPTKNLIPLVMKQEQFRTKGKEAVGLVNGFIMDSPRFTSSTDELAGLNELKFVMKAETQLETVEITTVDVISGVASSKAKQARPGRPAIFLE